MLKAEGPMPIMQCKSTGAKAAPKMLVKLTLDFTNINQADNDDHV